MVIVIDNERDKNGDRIYNVFVNSDQLIGNIIHFDEQWIFDNSNGVRYFTLSKNELQFLWQFIANLK